MFGRGRLSKFEQELRERAIENKDPLLVLVRYVWETDKVKVGEYMCSVSEDLAKKMVKAKHAKITVTVD